MNIHELLDQKFTSGNDVPVSSVRITREEYEAAVKHAVGGRDREADRHRFPDPAFNRWLDESITENGEFSVWHQLGDITPAWAAWESRPHYERKACDLCDCTGDIHDQTGEWRGECPYCRPQASAAVPEDVWKPLLEAVMREMPKQEYRGNAPGHAHAVPGIWDSDNVPYLAGKPCAWCLAYSTARKLLAASQPEVRNAE